MPKNMRPSMFHPQFRDKSLAEIEQAQNQYDLLEAQEKANALQQQQIQEIERANLLEQAKQENERRKEQAKRESENIKFYTEMCNKVGLKYELLSDFKNISNNIDFFWWENFKNSCMDFNTWLPIIDINVDLFDITTNILEKTRHKKVLFGRQKYKQELIKLDKLKKFTDECQQISIRAIDEFRTFIKSNYVGIYNEIISAVVGLNLFNHESKSRTQSLKEDSIGEDTKKINDGIGDKYNYKIASILDEYDNNLKVTIDKFVNEIKGMN